MLQTAADGKRGVRTSPEAKASKNPIDDDVLVAKLVHAIDLGSIGGIHAGSSPVQDTMIEQTSDSYEWFRRFFVSESIKSRLEF